MRKWTMLAILVLASVLRPAGVTAQEATAGGQAPAALSAQAEGAATGQETPAGAIPQTVSEPMDDADTALPPENDAGTEPDASLPHDLSPWGMFMAADVVVKSVMIGLALASVATWTIFIAKTLELAGAKRRIGKAVMRLTAAGGLRDAAEAFAGTRREPAFEMIAAAKEELSQSSAVLDHVPSAGVKERVASRLSRIEAAAGKRVAGGTGILASIGSISPFVGLFGTVWGIMNAFIGISKSQTTNLAIVAPGIAEALLATAIGLVAAIPAVVIYNAFARSISGYRLQLGDAAAAVERLVSRDLDHHAARRTMPRKQDQPHGDATIARIG